MIRDNSEHMVLDNLSPLGNVNQERPDPGYGVHAPSADLNPSAQAYGNTESIFGGAYGGLNDSGQSWMWDMNLTFPYFEPGEGG